MKRVQYEKNATWKQCSMKRVQHEMNAAWKECHIKRVEHGKIKGQVRSPWTSKMNSFVRIFNSLLIIGANLSILDVCGALGYTSWNSATGKIALWGVWNRRRKQNENIVACKSATWYRAIPKKSATRRKVQHQKITTQKYSTWKWCSMKKVQHEKSVTWKGCSMKIFKLSQ